VRQKEARQHLDIGTVALY